jgi:putative DNA primase/helicase
MNNDAFVKNVASRLIEQIKNGTAPWQKPRRPGTSFLPFNPTNGTRYKGINVVNLLARGHSDARWITYRQAQTKGYQVRRGEKGTQVQYWRFDEERKIKDSNGRPVIDANGGCTPKPLKLRFPVEVSSKPGAWRSQKWRLVATLVIRIQRLSMR